ncbi:MAG: citrate transporter [Clostridia bacterium]|nr:citrate transporter [Clostridia bacterium]
MKDKILRFVKDETVLAVAWVLALVSMCFVLPDAAYIDYIDLHTLGLLFALMGVMAGCRRLGLFRVLGSKLLGLARTTRQLELILVLLCFVSSMFITNDVALITFVPFAVEILALAGQKQRLIFVVTMQTVAANLGSMLLPVGNPQNIYLYTKTGCTLPEFILVVLPYAAVSLVLLVLAVCLRKNEKLAAFSTQNAALGGKPAALPVYAVLFVLCLLAVLKILPVWAAVLAVLLALLVLDASTLKQIDYALLLTFVGFFVFVGNMGRIPALRNAIAGILVGNEVVVSALLSQAISNVPAALLLSGFTENWQPLLIGVNLGGLGTIIASMASLISYKAIAKEDGLKGKYMLYFSVVNVVFLLVLLGVYFALVAIGV